MAVSHFHRQRWWGLCLCSHRLHLLHSQRSCGQSIYYDQRLQAVLGACGSLDLLTTTHDVYEVCCVLVQQSLIETTPNEYKYNTQW